MKSNALWIVLAEVEAFDSKGGLASGEKAFVNIIAPACSHDLVPALVSNKLRSMGFQLISIEKPEKWNTRFKSRVPDDNLSELAAVAFETSEVQISTFHTWDGQG